MAGEGRDEQYGESRPITPRLRAARLEGGRLPFAAAVLGIILAGLFLALRSRTQAPTASVLSRSAPTTLPGTPAAPTEAAHIEPLYAQASGTTGRERTHKRPTRLQVKRPVKRAALTTSLLALCAIAAVMVSGIAPPSPTIASASSTEDILPPPLADMVGAPAGPDCAVLKCVTLTFDDGPDPYSTPALLDILQSRGVPANFFVMGSLIQGNEHIILRMQHLGMGVENHTWNHPKLTELSPAAVTDQLARTNAELFRVLGYTPKYMRPPYGAWTPGYTPTLGMHPVLWEVDPQDWLHRHSATVTQHVVNHVGPGDVILLHDIHQTTVDAVPMIIDSLHERGYTFVTLDDLYATRPGCHVNQYCTAPVPYAGDPFASTTASADVNSSPIPPGALSPDHLGSH